MHSNIILTVIFKFLDNQKLRQFHFFSVTGKFQHRKNHCYYSSLTMISKSKNIKKDEF